MAGLAGLMLRHVVLFQILPDADAETVADTLRRLRTLEGIPGVIGLTAGRDVSGRGDYQVGLTCDFASERDLRGYLDHRDHMSLVREILPRAFRPGWQVVDFDIGDERPDA